MVDIRLYTIEEDRLFDNEILGVQKEYGYVFVFFFHLYERHKKTF